MAFNLGPRAIKFHPNIIALILLLTILFSNVLKAQDQTLSTIGDVLIFAMPATALAGFTAYSRIQADKHDGWDVLAGAIIGVGSSYIITTQYQKEHLEITFNSSDDNYLLGFKYKF